MRLLDAIERGELHTNRARLQFCPHRRGLHVVGTVDGEPVSAPSHPLIIRTPEAALTWLRGRLRRK